MYGTPPPPWAPPVPAYAPSVAPPTVRIRKGYPAGLVVALILVSAALAFTQARSIVAWSKCGATTPQSIALTIRHGSPGVLECVAVYGQNP